jgi:hypothetical protein
LGRKHARGPSRAWDRAPEPLNEDVVHPSALAVHAAGSSRVAEQASDGVSGQLPALIGVEHLRIVMPRQGFGRADRALLDNLMLFSILSAAELGARASKHFGFCSFITEGDAGRCCRLNRL